MGISSENGFERELIFCAVNFFISTSFINLLMLSECMEYAAEDVEHKAIHIFNPPIKNKKVMNL